MKVCQNTIETDECHIKKNNNIPRPTNPPKTKTKKMLGKGKYSFHPFYSNVLNTSAVSSICSGSILIFASCVIHRPLVSTDVVSHYPLNTYGSYGCCQGEHVNMKNKTLSVFVSLIFVVCWVGLGLRRSTVSILTIVLYGFLPNSYTTKVGTSQTP